MTFWGIHLKFFCTIHRLLVHTQRRDFFKSAKAHINCLILMGFCLFVFRRCYILLHLCCGFLYAPPPQKKNILLFSMKMVAMQSGSWWHGGSLCVPHNKCRGCSDATSDGPCWLSGDGKAELSGAGSPLAYMPII